MDAPTYREILQKTDTSTTPYSASWPLGASPNLVRDPWIPVRDLQGALRTVGIGDLLADAANLTEIATGHGPTDAALTILACAVVGAADVAANGKERRAILAAGHLPDIVATYLAKWESKFDLASPDGGFMQAPARALVGIKRTVPAKTLFPDSNDENDFKMYRRPSRDRLTWQEATRALIERQLFDLGGPVSSPIPVPENKGSHAVGGAAATSMIVYAVGRTFLETLVLNAPEREHGDAPTWEEPPTIGIATERRQGRLRAMTTRARTALLEYDENGSVVSMVFGPGVGFEAHQILESARFVLAYVNAKDEVRYPKVDIGRGAWNACYMAFMTNEAGRARLTFVENAQMYGDDDRASLPLRFVGYATNKKLVEFARVEEFAIPRSLMAKSADSMEALLASVEYARKAIDCGVNAIRDAARNMPSGMKARTSSEDFRARCYDLVSRRYQKLIDEIGGASGEDRRAYVRRWGREIVAVIGDETAEALATLDDARKYAEGMANYARFSLHDDLMTDAERAARPKRKSKNETEGTTETP